MEYQQTQPYEKAIPYVMPLKPYKVVGANIFTIKNNILLCILEYYNEFPVVKKAEGLSADNLIRVAKIVFAKFWLPKKIVSDADTNLTSDKLRQFCRQLNTEQAITSSYHHQSYGQVEACIKFMKCTIKNALIIMMTLTVLCCR